MNNTKHRSPFAIAARLIVLVRPMLSLSTLQRFQSFETISCVVIMQLYLRHHKDIRSIQ